MKRADLVKVEASVEDLVAWLVAQANVPAAISEGTPRLMCETKQGHAEITGHVWFTVCWEETEL